MDVDRRGHVSFLMGWRWQAGSLSAGCFREAAAP
jgi:hypothetical protein